MNAKFIRARVASWLRYERQCPIISFERGLSTFSRPDILAVTKTRHLVEVEVKVSLADFRHDAKKHKWRLYNRPMIHADERPRQFYFAVPEEMEEAAAGELRDSAGLLSVAKGGKVSVSVRAPTNKESPRLPLRDLIEMVRAQSGTLVTLALEEDGKR